MITIPSSVPKDRTIHERRLQLSQASLHFFLSLHPSWLACLFLFQILNNTYMDSLFFSYPHHPSRACDPWLPKQGSVKRIYKLTKLPGSAFAYTTKQHSHALQVPPVV